MIRTQHGIGMVALAATLAFAACAGSEAKEPDAAAAEAPSRVVSVEVMTTQPEVFTDRVQIVGDVEANRDVVVSAEESGVIRQLVVEKGQWVKAGQPLARIDDRVLRAQAEEAAARAELDAESWQRQKRLWEEDNVGTEMAYLQAKYGAQTSEAAARVAQERLGRTVVRAPISGIVEDRLVEVGSMVSPGAPVARIVDIGRVKVSGGVPERYAGEIQRGGEAEIVLDAFGGREFTGTIGFVGAAVDEGSRTFPIEVTIPNPNGLIKPGMIATVRVARGGSNEAIVVPQEAVLREEDGYIVYVATERGGETVAEARVVVPGSSQNNRVVIEAGLEPGERVIVVGQQQTAAGDRLEIVNENEGAGG